MTILLILLYVFFGGLVAAIFYRLSLKDAKIDDKFLHSLAIEKIQILSLAIFLVWPLATVMFAGFFLSDWILARLNIK